MHEERPVASPGRTDVHDFSQRNALHVVVTVGSGLGGAFAPVELLSAWAQAAAPFFAVAAVRLRAGDVKVPDNVR